LPSAWLVISIEQIFKLEIGIWNLVSQAFQISNKRGVPILNLSGDWLHDTIRQEVAMKFLPLVFLLFPCCGGNGPSGSPQSQTVGQSQNRQEAPLDQAALTKLAAADELDGSKDHLISKCAGCALAMDGSPNHTVKLAESTLQFCSAFCRDEFAKDPVGKLAGLVVPAHP
jgi:hypothetical protein